MSGTSHSPSLLRRGVQYLISQFYRNTGDATDRGYFVTVIERPVKAESRTGVRRSSEYKFYLDGESEAQLQRIHNECKRGLNGDEVVYTGVFNSDNHLANRELALAVLEFTNQANSIGFFDRARLEKRLEQIKL